MVEAGVVEKGAYFVISPTIIVIGVSVGVGGDGGEGCLEVNQYMFFGILFLESF